MDSVGSVTAGDPRSQIGYAVLAKAFEVARQRGEAANALVRDAAKVHPGKPGGVQPTDAPPGPGRGLDVTA